MNSLINTIISDSIKKDCTVTVVFTDVDVFVHLLASKTEKILTISIGFSGIKNKDIVCCMDTIPEVSDLPH